MASFSASDAALTGFRVVREHPKAVGIWAVIQFVISLGFTVGTVRFAGPALMSLNAANSAPARDPAKTMAIFQQLGPYYLCLILFSLAFYPILYATMNRAVLRPSEEKFGYIRLGADELRQLGLLLLVLLFGLVAYIAIIVASVAVLTPLSLMFAGGSGGLTNSNLFIGLFAVVFGLAVICLWIYVWTRLSLAPSLTFATGKINLFGSWRLTRGLFWPMLGAYLVALVLAMIVWLLTTVISLAAGDRVEGLGRDVAAAGFWPFVLAVMVAYGKLHANESVRINFLFWIKAKYLAIIYVLIYLAMELTSREKFGALVALCNAGVGFAFLSIAPRSGVRAGISEQWYGLRNSYLRAKRRRAAKKFTVYMRKQGKDVSLDEDGRYVDPNGKPHDPNDKRWMN